MMGDGPGFSKMERISRGTAGSNPPPSSRRERRDPGGQPDEGFTSSRAFRVAGPKVSGCPKEINIFLSTVIWLTLIDARRSYFAGARAFQAGSVAGQSEQKKHLAMRWEVPLVGG